MTRIRSLLHPFGWGALVGGMIVALVGMTSGDELGGLAWTYGILVVLAAAYLLAGLRIRAALAARSAPRRSSAPQHRPEASGA
jgi:uncharacterized membrane protein YebE (DUF533 family)